VYATFVWPLVLLSLVCAVVSPGFFFPEKLRYVFPSGSYWVVAAPFV
jgi:hypothetical protein